MDIRTLQRAIVDGLEDVKAQDIVVYNTEALSALFERVIIASGTSNRQTKALAASVRDRVHKDLYEQGGRVLSTEGLENGEWIIVDCGAAVVHIMQPAIRQYYQLEEIWGGKPVAVKLGVKRGLVKASAPDEADDADDVSGKPSRAKKKPSKADQADAAARKEAAAKSVPARKAKAAAPVAAKKAPARKAATRGGEAAPATRKAAPARKPAGAAGKTAAKTAATTAGRKAPARKTAASSAPMQVIKVKPNKAASDMLAEKKVASKKAAVRKAVARKAPARKTAAAPAPAPAPVARKAPIRKAAAAAPARKPAAPARKAAAAPAPAKKAAAWKAPARKAAPQAAVKAARKKPAA